MSAFIRLSLSLCLLCLFNACALPNADTQQAGSAPTDKPYFNAQTLAADIEAHLHKHELDLWFPRCIDHEFGGYHVHFTRTWTPGSITDKNLVFQARMVWICAEVAKRRPALAMQYLAYSRHGFKFLKERLWDHQRGGMYWAVNQQGLWEPRLGDTKHLYAMSFAIYAAANLHAAGGDEDALTFAKQVFHWIDQKAHDAKNGGYAEELSELGVPYQAAPLTLTSELIYDRIGILRGYRSMNTHIHLMEAFTTLYRRWPDPLLRQRLEELVHIVAERMYSEPGCMHMYLTPDWKPMSAGTSFGHNVETAYLLIEAITALGNPDDQKVHHVARLLVDHALRWGWDEKYGGLYDEGQAFRTAAVLHKIWWVQAESLNALSLMDQLYGTQTPRYREAFVRQWEYIRQYQTDADHGGWYGYVSRDGSHVAHKDKSGPWKAAYHTGRAMLEVSDRLRTTDPSP